MSTILEVKGLCKNYKEFSLKNVNLTLEKGYIMGFIGPNGAGKSTTIKLMMNLLHKDSGEIKMFGLDHIAHEQEIKNRLGFVFDETYFYEELTVEEAKTFIARFYQHWDGEVYRKLIKDFALPPKRKLKELSKGMKMKLSLAIALSHSADLILMDEPTSGLDPVVRSELLDILANLIQDENKAVFFSTHITSDLDKIADYITLIHDGEIIFSKEKDDLVEQYTMVKGGRELLLPDLKKEFIGLRENLYGFEGLMANRALAKQLFGTNVVLERPTLEDIMLYHVKGDKNA